MKIKQMQVLHPFVFPSTIVVTPCSEGWSDLFEPIKDPWGDDITPVKDEIHSFKRDPNLVPKVPDVAWQVSVSEKSDAHETEAILPYKGMSTVGSAQTSKSPL